MRFRINSLFLVLACFVCVLSITDGFAQSLKKESSKKQKKKTGSIYFSWGYNEETYTNSTLHVKQEGMGNDYELIHVHAQDHQGWNDGVLHKALTIPQYNYRLGYYFNEKQDLAIELNFDHTKYIISGMQNIHLKGTLNHRVVDSTIFWSDQNGDYYYLNNGANFFLFNIVKRMGLYHTHSNNIRLDLTGKAGVGPVIPHVQNSFFGYVNNQQFQLGGWNTGLELALRLTIMKYGYLEFSQKLDYARYSHLLINDGRASQNFGTYETILSLGVVLPTTKANPAFHKEQPKMDAPDK